jgi:glycosyltransferase involved in cell wall biosynthesis
MHPAAKSLPITKIRRQKVVTVTNIPAPYRVPVFNRLALSPDFEFTVVFCAEREPNRQWELPVLSCPHRFLKERLQIRSGRYVHNNPDVLGHLRQLRPDIVITTGFNPTHLFAFAYAMLTGSIHIAMTDGTLESEESLGRIHRLARRFVYSRTSAFIGASQGSRELYLHYGARPRAIFQSHLAADNARFAQVVNGERDFDLMFCGQLIPRKLPLFALEVAQRTSALLERSVTLLVVGTGPMQEEVVARAANFRGVKIEFAGHVSQERLPALYARSKVFLFPTLEDPWGVVANEACTAGLPVLISPAAGAADELVIPGVSGEVLPLDEDLWARSAAALLRDKDRWNQFSGAARRRAAGFTFETASRGIADAILFALNQ